MLERAVSRGQLPRGTDIDLIYDVVLGTLIYVVVLSPRRSDADRLDRAIDTILDGALRVAIRRAPSRRAVRARLLGA
jgi:hypothetical protein